MSTLLFFSDADLILTVCQTYAILLIFKEYEALYASSGWTGNPGPESSFLMRVVLPHSMQTISH